MLPLRGLKFVVVALLANLLRYPPVYPYAEPFARLVLEKVRVLSSLNAGCGMGEPMFEVGASGTRFAKYPENDCDTFLRMVPAREVRSSSSKTGVGGRDSSSGIGGWVFGFSMRRMLPSLGPPSGPKKQPKIDPRTKPDERYFRHTSEAKTPIKVTDAATAQGSRYGYWTNIVSSNTPGHLMAGRSTGDDVSSARNFEMRTTDKSLRLWHLPHHPCPNKIWERSLGQYQICTLNAIADPKIA
jgi:hypothetical protein